MFLLGRAGPSVVATLAPHGARLKHKPVKRRVKRKTSDPNAKVDRDEAGRPIVKQREKSLGTFRPMAPAQLTHELFQSDSRPELDLPVFNRQTLTPGTATSLLLRLRRPTVYMFRVLSKPCSLVRDTTLSVIRALEESKASFSSLVLNGRPGTGKSFLLLQAAEYAKATGWIVLYIPRGKSLVDSSTPYVYSLATQTYLQPRCAFQTLQRFATGTTAVSAGARLSALVAAGTADPAAAPAVLEHLLAELAAQVRFPVLLAIDDFQALYGRSLYRDPFFRFVRPHHLSMPRLLLEYASGRRAFTQRRRPRRPHPQRPAVPVPPQLREALRLPGDLAPSPLGPFARRSTQLAAYLSGPPPSSPQTPSTSSPQNQKPAKPDAPHRDAAAAVDTWDAWRLFPAPVREPADAQWSATPYTDPLYIHERGSGEDPDEYAAGKRMAGQVPRRAPTTLMRALRVPDKLNTAEALALFELWRAGRGLVGENPDEMFMAKYT
ncbi:mitochondrial ribosomal death-associated protein 3-domain-containing protein [Mycena rebaudengoi]|nr:mitochondrial ribosomal death-associated protein 3-domain-containing protein [Mycena rebaudengoi]